jgi:GABA(A) receptor-associated protein
MSLVALNNENDLSKRISESNRIISKFPDRIPVIVLTKNATLEKLLKKNKFLVPYDLSVSYLLASIRSQIKLDPSKALFLFCDNTLLSGSQSLNEIYKNYKSKHNIGISKDNFLYMSIEEENTFG